MEEKDLNLLVEKVGKEAAANITQLFSEAKEGLMTREDFESKIGEFDISGLEEKIEKVAVGLKGLQEMQPQKPETLKSLLEKNMDGLKELRDGRKSLILDVKTNVLTSSITSDTQAMRLPDVGQEATRRIMIPSLFRQASVSANNHGTIRYFDQSTVTRNADAKAEADDAPESALAWTEYSLTLEKLLDTIPVSHEAITDIDFVENEIRRFLEVNMALKEEQQVYAGNGTAPEWEGVYTNATEYTQVMGAAENKVQDANLYDLALYVATKITNGYAGKYMPNYVLLNPADVNRMRLEKDANGQYVIPPFVSRDGMDVAGMNIIESSLVTANTMLVGDFNMGTYYRQEGYTVELGYGNGQFIADLMTLKARKRGNLLVRNVDAGAFYKVTNLTTRISDITA